MQQQERTVASARQDGNPIPQLLVSVRNVVEARGALRGGCDLLDVKEPSRGPLGMADLSVINQAARQARAWSKLTGDVATTAALGETADWIDRLDRGEFPALPADVEIIKLGPARLAGRDDWQKMFRKVRRRFEEAAGRRLQWVAVCYADWTRAEAPSPEAVFQTAADDNLAGVLVDTFVKDGTGLLDLLDDHQLAHISNSVRESGRWLAVAGSLSIERVGELVDLCPDVIAVRSSVCRGRRRNGPIAVEAVRQFKRAIRAAFSQEGAPSRRKILRSRKRA